MNEEIEFNFDFIFELRDQERMIEFCMKVGLITKVYTCPQCGENMHLYKRSDVSDKYRWRCRKDDHDVRRSIRKGSWFEKSKLKMFDILMITYMWIMNIEGDWIAIDRGVSGKTVIDWKGFCREVCIDVCVRENEMLGGEGAIVEIDDSNFGKRKCGRKVEGTWVFGGVERGTNKCFFEVVSERSSTILLDVIRKYVLPGSIILSNCWNSYDCMENKEFVQLAANKTYQFKEPEGGEHINSIEGTWSAIKRKLKTNYRQGHFDSHLFEYMWRRKHKTEKHRLMYLFLQAVIQIYTPAQHD